MAVAQTHKSVVEHSHGKVQDFMFPSTGSLVRNFRDILKTVDPKDPKWYEAASTRWNELANEVNLMGQVLSTWRLEGGAGAAATV
ncbi:hypothetical protein FRB90_011700 [Tulasnella sp. 427]|nr:hypothetical protein FRB90_011700 [Tulasnella sp. 427]